MKKLIFFLLALFISSSSAAADIIIFKSGSAKEGIIEEENPTGVKLRVKNAVIGISWQNIETIQYATPEENRSLDRRWEDNELKRQEERKRKREEKEKFEKEQKDKGLVKAGARWVSRKEKAELEQAGIRNEMQAQEASRAAEQAASEAEEARRAEEAERAAEPAFLRNMTEEQRRRYKEHVGKMELTGVKISKVSEDYLIIKGRVTNKGEFTATRIVLEVTLYGTGGEAIARDFVKVSDLAPGQSRKLNVPFDIRANFAGSVKARVTALQWR
jgi:hypothetical protein